VTGCDASVVISVVSFLNRINGVGFREMRPDRFRNTPKEDLEQEILHTEKELEKEKEKYRVMGDLKFPATKLEKFKNDLKEELEIRNYCINEQWRDPHFLTFYALCLEVGERLEDLFRIVKKKPRTATEIKNCSGWIDYDKEIIHLTDSKAAAFISKNFLLIPTIFLKTTPFRKSKCLWIRSHPSS